MSVRAMPFVEFSRDICRMPMSRPQELYWAVAADNKNPADFEGDDRELLGQIFGPSVDVIPPHARTLQLAEKGARVGFTAGTGSYLVWRALTADCSVLAPGEVAHCLAVAPDVKTGRVLIDYSKGWAHNVPEISRLMESSTADGFIIRRPDGRRASISVFSASVGGRTLRGRSYIAAVMDESAFFYDSSTGAINDSELYRAISVRLTPGSKLFIGSTVWLPSGLLYEMVRKNWNDPQSATAAICPTLLMRPDSDLIKTVIAEELERDFANARREFFCEPLDGSAASFIDARAIDAMVDRSLPIGGSLCL